MPLPLSLSVQTEAWPIAGAFTISRGAKTEAQVVVAMLSDGRHRGRGECVPYGRYNETIASVLAEIEAICPQIEQGLTRPELQSAMKPGAARNAVDCALWDLEAKQKGKSVHELAGLSSPGTLTTAYTLSLAEPDAMRNQAAQYAHRAVLKIKVGT